MVGDTGADRRDGASRAGRLIGTVLGIALYGIVFYPIYWRMF